MNLMKAMDIWCQHITNTFNRNFNTTYNGHHIKGFRDGTNTHEAFTIIMKEIPLQNITEMTPENVNELFFAAISKLSTNSSETTENVYKYLENMISSGLIINKKFNDDEFSLILKFKEDASNLFEQEVIQNQINPNPSRTLRSSSSSGLFDGHLEQSIIDVVSRVLTSKFEEFENKILNERTMNKEESYDNCDVDELKKIMRFRIIRLLRHKNDIKVLEKHLENKTAPKSCFMTRFPRPILPNNTEAVKEHDTLIRKMQIDIMNKDIKLLANEIITIEADIENVKNFIIKKVTDNNASVDIYNSIYKAATEETKDEFDKAMQKVIAIFNNKQDISNEERLAKSKLKKQNKINYKTTSAPVSLNNSNSSQDLILEQYNPHVSSKLNNNTINNYNSCQHQQFQGQHIRQLKSYQQQQYQQHSNKKQHSFPQQSYQKQIYEQHQEQIRSNFNNKQNKNHQQYNYSGNTAGYARNLNQQFNQRAINFNEEVQRQQISLNYNNKSYANNSFQQQQHQKQQNIQQKQHNQQQIHFQQQQHNQQQQNYQQQQHYQQQQNYPQQQSHQVHSQNFFYSRPNALRR